jgi:hypothetical protein
MATTTPNFGWSVPTSTDLVKDGATAIETLGDSIDASLVDLKGGTSGQVLSKNSNTDMDFTWVTSDDANAIQNAIVDAKGDLIAATAADTPARLAVGTNGQVLTADSTASTGLKWAAIPSSGKVLQVVFASNSTASTITTTTLTDTGLTATITPSATNSKILVLASSINRHYKLSNIQGTKMALLRDATSIWSCDSVAYSQMSSSHSIATHTTPVVYLDSPNTTSAVTYKIQAAPQSTADSGNLTFNETGTSTITLLEIGA